MACIKEVNRSAQVAFSPDAPYLAAGTVAGAVDLQFSSSANFEIFRLDFQSDDRQLPLAGSVLSPERFNRLSWGKSPSSGSEEFALGLIAGGLVDGNIGLWNPSSLIRSESSEASEKALVQLLSWHKGPVRGLEFNSLSPNLLASGADEGEICIWDIAKPAEPTHFPPLKGSGSATQGEISFLSWNRKVQQILASTSFNGTTVVWDLRKQKPVISFSDSVRRRCSVLQWNPDFATQLIVASDDDSSPSLRVWDMRNTMSPLKELVGHSKGVVAMSWCPSDSSYLLTCAKDNRTICWDMVTSEIVSELPAGTNWNFDVHWYPKIPGVISASSFDGKIGVYNIEGCNRFGIGEGEFGAAPLRAPKWYKRKAGVSFGFGGKLVSLRTTDSGPSEVYLHNLVTKESLVTRSSEFEAAIQNGERSLLKSLCDKKSQESESGDDRETWAFLKVMFEDETARTKLLTHLGFSLPPEEKDVVDTLSQEASALGLEGTVADKQGHMGHKESALFPTDNGEDFFNNLPSPKADTPLSTSGDKFGGSEPSGEELPQQIDGQEETSDPSFEDAVQRALVVADYKGAVAQCILANRMADALVIANVGGSSLWEKTRDQYLKMSCSPYLKVVSAMVNNDLVGLVNTRPLKSWKETLALLCTFAQREDWTMLCDTLASRLMAAGNTLAATLCYICAGNIDKTVEIWSKSLTTEHDAKSYFDLLQDLMEKTIVLALATGQKRFSASLCKLVEKYAEILSSQGLLSTAMEYLKLVGSEELSPELMILRDRIALSIEQVTQSEVPFSVASENIHPQPASYGPDQNNYGAVDASQLYHQETAPSQVQQSVSGSSYGENYQQFVAPYRGGYAAPPPYQSAPQPNIFVPAPAPQVPPQANLTPPPFPAQPTKQFQPANPPALRNVEQYQQQTLGSQLYPGSSNPPYQAGPPVAGSLGPISTQMGPAPGPTMPQVLAPASVPRGFTPVISSAVQRPGLGPMQQPSPQSAPIQSVVPPPAPPPTVQTADTSNVPAQQKPVVNTLTRLFKETSEALGSSKKREIEDNSRKLGTLFSKLNNGDISRNVAEKLVQLCQALDNGDFGAANRIQIQLSGSDWDECQFWLTPLRRMIKIRQSMR